MNFLSEPPLLINFLAFFLFWSFSKKSGVVGFMGSECKLNAIASNVCLVLDVVDDLNRFQILPYHNPWFSAFSLSATIVRDFRLNSFTITFVYRFFCVKKL